MNFAVELETIATDNLKMDYFLVPWDTEIFNCQVAQISIIEIDNQSQAKKDLKPYQEWCDQQKIEFCSCRIAHDKIKESIFLEEQGFRFIELNYQPVLTNLQKLIFNDSDIQIAVADEHDQPLLADAAATIFHHERFHIDPRINSDLANNRYRIWLENGFKLPQQTVLKCSLNSKIIGFFVIEYPEPKHCFWSLVGILPNYQGQGLGKKVWQAMLHWHQIAGVERVSTSISSHNISVFNLYVALGFRFPMPNSTFHWAI